MTVFCKISSILALYCLCLVSACGKTNPDIKVSRSHKGLIMNEIAAHEETGGLSWVEVKNISSKAVSLKGIGIYLSDAESKNKCIWSFRGGKLSPGETVVVGTTDDLLSSGISSDNDFTLRLGTADGSVDKFSRSADCDSYLGKRGSYQRIPDGTGSWRSLTYNSRGRENQIYDYREVKRTGLWMWSSHMAPMMENDAAFLKEYYMLGYRHLLLNSAAFTKYPALCAEFLDKAEEIGFTVHGWIQVFQKGGSWNVPIDNGTKTIKEDVYKDLRERARVAIEDFGVKGLHLDYIRFPGTASKYDFSPEVNSIAAVNRACREIREIADGYGEGIVTSAALMPEPNSTAKYAQDPSQMGQYLHILIPMCYRYAYGMTDDRVIEVMNWFCDRSSGAEVWSGIQTYDRNEVGMFDSAILKDATLYSKSKANGLILFRFGLGVFPMINDLYPSGK